MANMQEMKNWTDYIASLPDEKFFYIMRLYLGEIKTPFNKLRLTEQLASFLRTQKHLSSLINLLDETDVKFLTVINLIPGIAQETLRKFFENEFSTSLIYSRLANLQDRLLVYTKKKQYSDVVQFWINPLILEEVKPYLNPELVFPDPVLEQTFIDTPFILNPNFLAAFISYININGCNLKSDGKFRKTDAANLEEIFGEKLSCLQFLISAFSNLGMVQEGEKGLVLNEKYLSAFSRMEEKQQYIFLAVASVIRLSRDGLKKQCQLLADTLASVPETGVTKRVFLRMAQFIAGRPVPENTVKTVSRFSEMLNRMKNDGETVTDEISLMDSIFDAAVEFGLLTIYGESEDGENVYIPGICTENVQTFTNGSPKVININAASSVTLLPGLPLEKLIPLTFFMQAVKCSTVTEYEISRKSVSFGFDKGYSLEKIKEILSEYDSFELPQNLLFNLEEWHTAYSSVVLYKGYILKVSKENIPLVENNPSLSVHVTEKLAEGVYLLDIPVEENPANFIKGYGLDFMGSIKTIKKETEVLALPKICAGSHFTFGKGTGEFVSVSEEASQEEENKYLGILEESGFDEQQIEGLQNRILNHLIISENQLVSTSVRSEILKADGIDFYGKIHLIEASIKNNDILLLTLPSEEKTDEEVLVKVRPVKIIKNEGEAILKFEVPPDREQKSFLVSRIRHIKRIRD